MFTPVLHNVLLIILYRLLTVILHTRTTVITISNYRFSNHNIDTYHGSSANLATDRQINLSHTESVHNAYNPESLNDNSSSTDERVNSATIDLLQVLEVDPAWMIP